MKIVFTIITLMIFSFLNAQDINLVWAKNFEGTIFGNGASIAVDSSGNVYTTGNFIGTADFDPGSGTSNLTSAGGNDIFISKLDAIGNFVWAKQLGGTGTDLGNSIAVDISGNVYTTGNFTGTADFDPGTGTNNLTSSVGAEIFVSKLDASGNFIWARKMGNDSLPDFSRSIALDNFGNVYITGQYMGIADFDPGAATFNLTSAGRFDIFITKLNSAGNFVSAQSMGGASDDVGNSIAVDISGNVYTTGLFTTVADFDPGAGTNNLTAAGVEDAFVSKLNSSGNFVFAKRIGGTFFDIGRSVTVDASGNVYTTGSFIGTADFDSGAGITNITSAGGSDVFINKLDSLGNFVWAKSMGGASTDVGNSIAVDISGNVYTTGFFNTVADFDPGAGTTNITSAGSNDIFISKLDALGNFVWAKSMGGALRDMGNSIKVDSSGNLHLTGNFQGTADFDPSAGTSNLTSAGDFDAFIVKLSQSGTLPITLTSAKAYEKNSGVQVEWITQQENNVDRFEVEVSLNGQQFSKVGSVQAKGNSNTISKYNFFNPNPVIGVHFYRLKIIDKSGEVTYSPVMKINSSKGTPQLTFYPNPIAGNTIVLQLNNFSKGIYTLTVTNKLGQPIFNKSIGHSGGSATEIIHLTKMLKAGVYQLKLTGEEVNIIRQVMKN